MPLLRQESAKTVPASVPPPHRDYRDTHKVMIPRLTAVVTALLLTGCAPLPVYTTLPVEQRPSPNFNERRPNYVILHHTGSNTVARALMVLTDPSRKVSAHYLIGRDGRLYYLVDERARAWHAGESYWAGNRDLNSGSIGIELDNDGSEPFAAPQIDALLALLADLAQRYGIPPENVLGHGDVAPGRKVDPSELFPWRRLAEAGFGLWCEPPYPPAPAHADPLLLLAALGYDLSRPFSAITAFKRRYAPGTPVAEMTDNDLALLQCLVNRKRERS